jgi:hypothetical protein
MYLRWTEAWQDWPGVRGLLLARPFAKERDVEHRIGDSSRDRNYCSDRSVTPGLTYTS